MKEKFKKILKLSSMFLRKEWFKISIIVAVLLISFSVFYYYVIFLPQKEQRRIELQKQEQLEKEIKEQQEKEKGQINLDTCIASAEQKYTNMWNKECEVIGKISTECKEILETNYNEYLEKYGITDEDYKKQRNISDDSLLSGLVDYYNRRDDCSCRLPTSTADRLGDVLKRDKDECFKKYPVK